MAGITEKLAIFLPSLRGGGAERAMLTLAGEFAARSIDVDLVLAKADGAYLADVGTSIRVVDLGAKRVAAALPGLVRYFQRERPTAAISAPAHANVIAIWARVAAGVPGRLILTEHNAMSRFESASRPREKMLPALMKLSYPKADGIVAVSAGVADGLARMTGIKRERIEVVHNPVVTETLCEKAQEPLYHPWFDPGAPPVVLGVGRLTPQKDFRTLIRAFAIARSRRPCRLVILGEGGERAELMRLAQDLGIGKEAALPGFVSNPFPYMRRAALFVLSSRWEGLPTVLVEAMACGAHVISTDCPNGPAEILEGGRYGSLVPVGAPESLAEAIILALSGKEPAATGARAADFSVERAVERYLAKLGLGG